MKIVFALTYYDNSLFIGGTQSLVRRLSLELCRKGEELYILTINHRKGKTSDSLLITKSEDLNIIKINHKGSLFAKFKRKIVRRLFKTGYILKRKECYQFLYDADVIVFFDVNEMTFPFHLNRFNGLKVFYCCTLLEKEDYFRKNPFSRLLLKNSSDYYLASNVETKSALKRLGVEESKIEVIPYGIEIDKYQRNASYSFDVKRIGFLGGIEERKGIHILLEACKKLDMPFRLMIAGQIRDEKYFNDIKKEIDMINKRENCEAKYIGCLPDEEMVSFYSSLTVFVCPSLSEEFGIVILEAMACETPVIASKEGGLKTIIEDGKSGLLFEKGNAEELNRKLDLILSDKEFALKLAKEGRKRVEGQYSIEKTGEKFLSFLRDKRKISRL
ncbi:MAG: glycosyltransferase family 1 protein [Candidatus Schekmanbacteria bacterium]|nr:MAG: glycosyltransferase family 1 protein [Candidatus Schekmanbacteria bacterium]